MPEPLFEIRVPSRAGVSLAVWSLAERGAGLWMIDVIMDGFAVRSAACSFLGEASRLAADCATKLSAGDAIEDLPLAAIPAHRVRPAAEIVPVPLHSTEYFRALPWDGDHDPDGGVFQ